MNKLLGLRALAHTDALTGSATFESDVTAQLVADGEGVLDSEFGVTTFTITGLLAMDVYFAYNDAAALTLAQSLWNLAFTSQVQPDQRFPRVRTITHNTNHDRPLNPSLSSYLYKATQNATYLASAELAAQFVRKQLAGGVPLNDIDIASCAISSSNTGPGDAGFVLEGLATLSALTNSPFDDFMRTLIASTVPFSAWTGPDGIFLADADAANLINAELTPPEFIRGLHEAWSSMDAQDPAALFIQSFLMVQYNALLNLASANNTYALNWHGPPPTQVDSVAQTAPLDVLNAAIVVGLPDA
ncbi:hypothetical protein EIP86_006757 [Pleurotus ostreatoroseus]|nr:hypothetical protein EIP86_006757 [Pleurotus ostreatoroseus]